MSETVNIMTVTLPLTGLPLECPHCGAPAPDGQWGIGVHGNLLHVICPRCYTAIAPVRGVAAGTDYHAGCATIAEHAELQRQVSALVDHVTQLARIVNGRA